MSLAGKQQLHRNYSGQVEASQMGSLAKDISGSRKKLIDQGVTSLIASLITDLQVILHLPIMSCVPVIADRSVKNTPSGLVKLLASAI